MENLLVNAINTKTLLLVLAIVAVLAIVFAVLIVLVSKLCAVKEDQKVKDVSSHLAGANCGGCGYAGCNDYAKALVEGKATLNSCGATPCEEKEQIAKILDVPFSAVSTDYAVVKCAGGRDCLTKFDYVGNEDCNFINVNFNGNKACSFACLGGGTCTKACTDGGIKMKDGTPVADKAICSACGACMRACPKHLIDLIPKKAKVYVACSSKCKGKDVMGVCKVGCIGCGLCAKNCPENAITMVDNLPVIDYSKCTGCKTCVLKCPRKTIKEI